MGSTAASGEVSPPVLVLSQQEFDEPPFVLGLVRHPDETPGDLDPPPADRDPEDRDAESNGRVHDPAHEFHTLLAVHSAEPVKDIVSRQAPRPRCLGEELASNPECLSGRCCRRGWISQGRDLQDSRHLAVNRVGDRPCSRYRGPSSRPACPGCPRRASRWARRPRSFGAADGSYGQTEPPTRRRPRASISINMRRSGLPPPRRATSRATSSTRISDQCPTRAVYEGVENLPAGQPGPSRSGRDDSGEPVNSRPLHHSRRANGCPGGPLLPALPRWAAPVGIGMLHPLLGEVIAITEIAVVLTVIAVALFGSKTLSERAFRLLRWFGNRAEPPAPR